MNSGLFVAYENVANLFLLEKCVIDVQHGAAWIAEYVFDLFFLQAPDYNFRSSQHHRKVAL